mgnify:CR=1 FL=1
MKRKTFILLFLFSSFAVMAQQPPINDNLPAISDNGAKSENTRFSLGFYHTGDFYKQAAGTGLGLMCNIGAKSDFLNVALGVEYIEYLGADPRPEEKKNGLGIVDAGAQVVIPAFVKLQLFSTSKWTKFYVGCGGEFGFKARDGGVMKHYYEENSVFRKSSLAIVPVIGWKSSAVDFGVYYKHYIDKPFNNSLDGKKNFGDEKARIGYFLTCYF